MSTVEAKDPVVHVTMDDGVTTLTLDNPPVNALNSALIASLQEATARVRADNTVRAVVIAGSPMFAAGGDVKEMVEWDYAAAVWGSRALGDACDALAALPIPVVAAISGLALGGGLEVALAADLRVCTDNARLGFPEVQLGLIPGAGGTQRLPRVVGDSRAKDLILTGRTLKAPEALSIGLVDRVVAADELAQAVQEIVEPFRKGPALAIRAAKAAIDQGGQVPLPSGLQIERGLFDGLFATEDRRIGMTTFLEKGPGQAEFIGR
ncbi:MAG: enoyl-CoA hydratase/isomerase family protein [Nostocoides sp.]